MHDCTFCIILRVWAVTVRTGQQAATGSQWRWQSILTAESESYSVLFIYLHDTVCSSVYIEKQDMGNRCVAFAFISLNRLFDKGCNYSKECFFILLSTQLSWTQIHSIKHSVNRSQGEELPGGIVRQEKSFTWPEILCLILCSAGPVCYIFIFKNHVR